MTGATSGRMLWTGGRTRPPDHAHVEYCRRVCSPIGLKCGPQLDPGTQVRLTEILNPDNEPGRMTLVARFGHDKVERHLPVLIRAIKDSGRKAVWSCDPMHGSTINNRGYRTRPFKRIL